MELNYNWKENIISLLHAFSKSNVCFGPEIERPGVGRHIESYWFNGEVYFMGGRGSGIYSLNERSTNLMLRTNFTLFRKKIKNEDIYIKTLTIIDVYSRLHCEVLQLQRMLSDWAGYYPGTDGRRGCGSLLGCLG